MGKTKIPKNHKHTWENATFVGEPHQWAAKIVSTCICGKTQERTPTWEESAARHRKITCPTCGSEHSDDRGGAGCIAELVQRLMKLEDRVNSLRVTFERD
jgi:hypothetical protein